MFKFLVLLGLVVVFVVVLGLMSPRGDSAALAQPPAGQATATQPGEDRPGAAPPGTHGVPGTPPVLPREQIEKRISPEERETLGLAEPTWTAQGKVHPDVQKVLEKGDMPWLKAKGFLPSNWQGIAYVAVYLRHQQQGERTSKENQRAIKEAQSRVLSRLTAADFRVLYTFKKTAGVLGFVNASGLTELEQDADVVAVGLDEKPVPNRPPPIMEEERPSRQGERAKIIPSPPPERIGKIEADVYWALEKSDDGYADVLVNLNRPIEWPIPYDEKKTIMRQMEDRILSSLTAEDFRLTSRTGGLSGRANAAGVAKLDKHPDVWGVGLSCAFRVEKLPPAQEMRAPR